MIRRIRFFAVASILLFSLILMGWGFKPSVHESRTQIILPREMELPLPSTPVPVSASTQVSSSPENSRPTIPETRHLILEYPSKISAGDSSIVTLTLNVDQQSGGTVQTPNLYETRNIIARARIDMPGVEVNPAGDINEPLYAGQSVTFSWSLRPQGAGDYRGTVWLNLILIPKAGGDERRIAISAQQIYIQSITFLGLSGSRARWLGGVVFLIGALAGIHFWGDIVDWLRNRQKSGKKR